MLFVPGLLTKNIEFINFAINSTVETRLFRDLI